MRALDPAMRLAIGARIRQLAAAYQVSYGTAWNTLASLGVERRPPGCPS